MRFARLASALGADDPAIRLAMLLTTETVRRPPTDLLNEDTQQILALKTDPFLAYRKCADRFSGEDPVQQMLLTDLCLELPSRFLPKVDRATMAMGLEARVPFLDETVARLAVNIPSRWKADGSQKKIVLRKALRGRVPDFILDGPKTGFGVPYQYWLRNQMFEFARDEVLDSGFSQRFGFERRKLESAFSEFRNEVRDWGPTLWKIFQMALWEKACKAI
jgi:asparagine synthase (glutamine-hydrolysing)